MTNLIRAFFVLVCFLIQTGCASIGNGTHSLILATPECASHSEVCSYSGSEFSHLKKTKDRKIVGLAGTKPLEQSDWELFKANKYGVGGDAIDMGIALRDRTATPAIGYHNFDVVNQSVISGILTNDELDDTQKQAAIISLRDNYRGLPETYSRFIKHRQDLESGAFTYKYFPQITIDLTASVNSADPLDRLDYFAAAIRIPEGVKAKFINVSPKSADLFQFTIGQLNQAATAQATGQAGRNTTDGTTSSNSIVTTSDNGSNTETLGETGSTVGNLGLSFGASVNETFTREIRSSLEARSVGIHDNGQLLLVELRGNNERRIAGTHTFDVMLEVDSEAKGSDADSGFVESHPIDKAVDVEIRLAGIVRHVVEQGKTGWINRIPETTNDVTFNEVVLTNENMNLWTFNDTPWADVADIPTRSNLVIQTNEADAAYYIEDSKGNILGWGSGVRTNFNINSQDMLKVVFADINRTDETPKVLAAEPSPTFMLSTNSDVSPKIIAGTYSIK